LTDEETIQSLCTGDVTVSQRWKPIVAYVSLLLVTVAAGCGSSSDGKQSPPAAIDGSSGGGGAEGGGATPAAKSTADSKHPVVVIETSLGKITLELDREKAPLTVENFLQYVNASFYDQSVIHQVFKGQAIIAGGYGTNLLPIAKPAHAAVRNEAGDPNALKNLRGTIAMVRFPNSIHSATTQFMINVADNPALDYKDRTPAGYGYCVFGKVTDGSDVVNKINEIALRDTTALERTPAEPLVVTSIRWVR
jgi:peptidyl-prolyl cis-trans isomerase B (cyclophilin B)